MAWEGGPGLAMASSRIGNRSIRSCTIFPDYSRTATSDTHGCTGKRRTVFEANSRHAAATIRLPKSRNLSLPDLRQPVLLREIGLRRRGPEQCTCLGLIVGDRGHGEVSVLQPLRIMLDAQIEAPQPQV